MGYGQTIRIKAELLCLGLHPSRSASTIYRRQNPRKEFKTGNVGLHFSLPGGSCVLATVSHKFDKRSLLRIEKDNGAFVLEKAGTALMYVTPIVMPKWYSKPTSDAIAMTEIFLHEGRKYLHQTYEGCDFHVKNIGCRFCGTGKKWRIGTPTQVNETVDAALAEDETYHVCLGGGTRLPLRRSVQYFADCLDAIKAHRINAPIWIEMPPPNEDDIEMLVEKGATSFGFNIEIWNDETRRQICPGKSMFSKEQYFKAFHKAQRLLGPNRVGSCLLVGVEDKHFTVEGVHVMVSEGVQPCLLPFKPWDNSVLRDSIPCDPNLLLEISEVAVQGMRKNGIDPTENQGCLQCEGCTVDHDIYSN